MTKNIHDIIKYNTKINFEDLSKQLPDFSKKELALELKNLENNKQTAQINNFYYDLNSYPEVSGYTQWGLNGLCWLSATNKSNLYGITFDPSENLTSIYNKKDTFYGHYVQGRIIIENNKSIVIVSNSQPIVDVNLIAAYSKIKNQWTILNANTSFSFELLLDNIQDGDIYQFKYTKNSYQVEKKMGNKNDIGIESLIVETIAFIKNAPSSEFDKIKNISAKKLLLDFYTIDSIYTADVDDAIYIESNDTGYKLWVAIADVSSYVIPGDIQDTHAKQVCTSFYLSHHVTHMLDRKLAEKYCSLNVGETKTALVCEMQFDFTGSMIAKDFYNAEVTIKSRLSYDDVDRIINGQKPVESFILNNNNVQKFKDLYEGKEIISSLFVLEKFSKLKTKEQIQNYFVIDNPDFHLNLNGKIDYLYFKNENSISQQMVTSAMLVTNIAASKILVEHYPQLGIFRNQIAPLELNRPKPASYEFNNEGHWGLQAESYTHFTSPIRRYCDLIVHRLIKSIISEKPTYKPEDLISISKQINLQQYISKQCTIKVKNLLIPQYIENLVNNNLLNNKLNIVDFSSNGLVCRNEQHIDFFIPTFKLEPYISKTIKKMIPLDSILSVEEKKANIKFLNNKWDIYMQLNSFSWTEERKNVMFQFQNKKINLQNNIKI